jgi:hypothetical protein
MKKLVLSAFVFLLSCIVINAQNGTLKISTPKTVLVNPVQLQGIDSMPNAFANEEYSFKKVGNNGKGFDLYQSSIDNMIVAKPDSSFADAMGNNIKTNTFKKLYQKQQQNNIQPQHQFKYYSIPKNKIDSLLPKH